MAFIYVTLIEFLFVHHFFLKHGVCTKSFNTANCTKISNNGGRRKRSKRLGGHEMNLYGYVKYTHISTRKRCNHRKIYLFILFYLFNILIVQSLVQLCLRAYRQCHVTVLTTANEKIVGIVIWNAHITLYQTLEG